MGASFLRDAGWADNTGSMSNPPTAPSRRHAAALVLAALIVGLGLGAAARASGVDGLMQAASGVEVVGTMWINAIRMTVIPLVAALTVAAVATSGDAASLGRVGGWAVAVFTGLLLMGGFVAMLAAPLSIDRLEIPPDVAARLRESLAGATAAPATMPPLAQRIVDIVPVNPIKAAVDGAILPVVVFALALGLALTRVPTERRDAIVTVCRAVSDALLVLVQWVLALAPIGVLALAIALGTKMGAASAGALVRYVVTLSVVLVIVTALLYPIAAVAGRVSPLRFAAAAAPAQAVAFSVRSSLAALPAMITAVRDTLGLGSRASGFTLPLAVSVFRINVPIAWVVGLLFLGKLYGVPMPAATLAMLVLTATLLSYSVPGLPSASLFLLSPVLAQHGIPVEGVGILIAVDAIPDMFKTTANVTAHLASTVVVARMDEKPGQDKPGSGR